MARRKPSKTNKPSDRRRKAATKPAKDVEPELGNMDGEEDDDGPGDDVLDFQMSDDDIDSIDDPESWDEYVPEEEEDDDEHFRRRRKIRDDELKWEEEALGDWREMESYRREYNDR